MTNSTSEREQRLRQIRANRDTAFAESKRFRYYDPPTWDDVNFLLSLLDSEAAGDPTHCALCEDPGFIYRDCVLAAATSMRDLCVEKVKKKAASYQADVDRLGAALKYRERMAYTASALREVANELQSLTLEQEQK